MRHLFLLLLAVLCSALQSYAVVLPESEMQRTELEVTNIVTEYTDARNHKNRYIELEYHNGKLFFTSDGLYDINCDYNFNIKSYIAGNIIWVEGYYARADKLLLGDQVHKLIYRKDVINGIPRGEYILSYKTPRNGIPDEEKSLRVDLYEGYSETIQVKYNSATNVIDPDYERVYVHDSRLGFDDALVYERFLNVVKGENIDETTAELYRYTPGHYDDGAIVAYLRADINGIYAKAPSSSLPKNYWSYYGSSVNPQTVIGDNEESQFKINIPKGETMFVRDIISGGFQAFTNVNEDFDNRDRFIKFQNGMIWLEDVGNIGEGAHCLAWPSLNAPGLDRDALKLMMVRRISDGSTVYVNHDLYDKHRSMSSVEISLKDKTALYMTESHINYNTDEVRGELLIYSPSGDLIRQVDGNGILNIPLSDLYPGIYIVIGQTPNHSESMTIVRP